MRFLSVVVLMFLAVACSSPTQLPTPAPEPSCKGAVCVNAAYLNISGNDLLFNFQLVTPTGSAKFGNDLLFDDTITVGLYRLEDGGENTYLFGATVPLSLQNCYAGNDIPWADGEFAAVCGFSAAVTMMQERPEVGDKVQVEILEYDFSRDVVIGEQ